jgi:hypothetical protein
MSQSSLTSVQGIVSNFTGCTSTVAGSAGSVPAPAAGAENSVLTGAGTFQTLSALQDTSAMVYAVNTSGQSIPNGSVDTVITNWTETTDTTGSFDATTGIFTAPRTGNYSITANTGTSAGNAWTVTDGWRTFISVNGTNIARNTCNAQATATYVLNSAVAVNYRLTAGDTVTMGVSNGRTGGAVTLNTTSPVNTFSIVEIPSVI